MAIKVTLELSEEQAMTVLSALNAKDQELSDDEFTEHAQRRADVRNALLPKYRERWEAAHARERENVKAMWSSVMDALDKARDQDTQET